MVRTSIVVRLFFCRHYLSRRLCVPDHTNPLTNTTRLFIYLTRLLTYIIPIILNTKSDNLLPKYWYLSPFRSFLRFHNLTLTTIILSTEKNLLYILVYLSLSYTYTYVCV